MRYLLVVLCVVLSSPLLAAPTVQVEYGAAGVASLKWNDAELLAPKAPPALSVLAADGKPVKLPAPEISAQGDTLTRRYAGLVVTTRFERRDNALRLTTTYRNTGSEPIAQIDDRPLALQFPQRPKGKSWKWGYDVTADTTDAPGFAVADWGDGKAVVCVEPATGKQPSVTVGFVGNHYNHPHNALMWRTTFAAPLAPGAETTIHGSVRFAAAEASATSVVADLYENYLQACPFTMNWPDRRPIGAIFLARSAAKWPTNPRGWFNDEKVDVMTDAGRAAFRDRMLKLADTCIAQIKETGGQGMLFWDVEGGEMPHAITYLGDPRVLPQAAPEMDAVADAFFKKFLDAGLRTGVCIRPSKVIPDGKGGWKHQQVDDHVAEMADKIAYAKRRWGCTLIYMDTNVKWPMKDDPSRGMWQGNATMLPSADLVELCRRHPDVLIFPEFGRFGYWSVCAPYAELRGGKTRTGDDVRCAYPHTGSVIAVGDGDYLGRWDDLLTGVAAGDIHLFRGWFGDSRNADVRRMYQEADLVRAEKTARIAGDLRTLLASPAPVARYAGVCRVAKPTAAETELLLKALPGEPEWVIKRRIVIALGTPGNAAAVPALTELAKDPKRGLDHVALSALGRIGPPATGTLVAWATGKDRRLAESALLALAESDDPAATAPLLALTENQNASVRAAAARALGLRGNQEVNARLVALLSDPDSAVIIAACAALGETQDRGAIQPLVDLIVRSVSELKNNTIREAAGDALEAITGKQFGPSEGKWKKALAAGEL